MTVFEKNIPEFNIADINQNSRDFFILDFDESNINLLKKFSSPGKTKFFQLIFLNEGEFVVTLDDEIYTLNSGSVFSIPSNHIYTLHPGASGNGNLILFTEEFICRSQDDYCSFSAYKLFENSGSLICPPKSGFNEIRRLIKSMRLEIFNICSNLRHEANQHLLKTILLVLEKLKRDSMIVNEINNNADVTIVKSFKDTLESGFRCNHSVNYYSDLLNITPKKLNRISIIHFGKPVKRIIEERVLLETKRLLKYSSLSIKEISTNVGFTDPAYFNRFFKKFVAQTPVEFRGYARKVS